MLHYLVFRRHFSFLVILASGFCATQSIAQTYLGTTANLAIGFYQKLMSPVRQPTSKCQFYPSCSQYAKEAIGSFGPFVGVVLTADRLMRCGTHAHPDIYPFSGKLYKDPAKNNYLFGGGGLWKLGYSNHTNLTDTVRVAVPFQFAYKLFTEGAFDYSVIELKREQLSLENKDDENFSYALIAACHFANNAIKKARVEIDRLDPSQLSTMRRQNAFLLDYLIADFEELDTWNASRCDQAALYDPSLSARLKTYSLTKAEEYDKARALLGDVRNDVDAVEFSGSRSELLAGIMSAVLPGSGYIYAGRIGEGISALTFNALLGWGIYSLFKNHNTGSGILLSTFTLPFYLGNIVGATNAAMAENAKEREIALGTLRRALGLDFYFSMDFLKQCWQ